MKNYNYIVLGSGMQGTAGGYALATQGQANKVLMADINILQAKDAAKKINSLLDEDIVSGVNIDVSNVDALTKTLLDNDIDGVFAATSYELNLGITEACIAAGCHMIDLGGNTDVVLKQQELSKKAVTKNLSIVPDCGLAPGLGNVLASAGISALDSCSNVDIFCGGLPQNPKPPLNYKLVFSVKGLTNEYFGKATVLRDGKVEQIDTFSELQQINTPLGELEAFTTTGGSSTCPWTYRGQVQEFNYKTVRYKGHYDQIKCLLDLGLLDDKPVLNDVSPRDIFHKVVPEKIAFPEDNDLVFLRTKCIGLKDGVITELQYEVVDYHDDGTGFSAMERMTAFPAALTLIQAVTGVSDKGVICLEKGIDCEAIISDLNNFGIKIVETTHTNYLEMQKGL